MWAAKRYDIYRLFVLSLQLRTIQSQKRFRVLKISRSSLDKLDIIDDGVDYSEDEIEVRPLAQVLRVRLILVSTGFANTDQCHV